MVNHVCVQCGADDMVHDTRDLPFKYKGNTTTIHAVAGWYCQHCEEAYLDDMAAYSSAIDKFAESIDAGEAKELARVRRKLKMTQQEAARLTGGGPNAFSRYELGKVKPLPAIINLFKLLDRHPELLDEIRTE